MSINPGDHFGHWEVLHEIPATTPTRYMCRCACGSIIPVIGKNLLAEKSTRCRKCANIRMYPNRKPKITKLLGAKFGSLTVLSFGNNKFTCRCDCGKIVEKYRNSLIHTKNLACLECRLEKERPDDFIGYQYENIKITGVKRVRNAYYFECKCKCGKIFTMPQYKLHIYKSCGCKKYAGQKLGEKNPNSKYKDSDIIALRDLHKTGLYSVKDLQKMFNMDRYIYLVLSGVARKSCSNSSSTKSNTKVK